MNRHAPKTELAYDKASGTILGHDEKRKHLGASVIGHKCDRQVWYKFRWARDNVFEPRMLRLFNRGHREEPAMARFLAALPGVTLYLAGDDGADKEAMRISDCDGHFGGTPDGIIHNLPDFPGEYLLLEFKTFNDNQFKKLAEDGVMTAKWEYFVQMQVYMEKHRLGKALFMAVNKNDDTVYFEIVYANAPEAQKAIQRAGRIIAATEPPARISDSPAWWECKWCDYKEICHHRDIPAINCRTCAYSSVAPNGQWACARDRPEITGAGVCPEHVYDPRFFDGVEVLGADFERNEIMVFDGVAKDIWGPRKTSSVRLRKVGFVPF